MALPENDTSKGLEKAINKITGRILDFDKKANLIFYGNPEKKKNKILRAGIYRILQELNGIPLCNIVNYILSKVKIPSSPLITKINDISTKLSNTINDINKFPLQSFQSQRYSADGRLQINVIQFTEQQINELRELRELINDSFTPEILSSMSQFPAGAKARETIFLLLSYLNGISTLQTLPTTKFQNIQKALDDTQGILTAVKLASGNPTALIPGINKHINTLNQYVKPERLVPFITELMRILNNFNKGIRVAIKIAKLLRSIAKVIKVISRVIKIVIRILKKIPIPNKITTVGITTSASGRLLKADKKADDLKKRGDQLLVATSIIVNVLRGLSSKLNLIIIELNKLLITILSCNLFDGTNAAEELRNQITSITETQKELNEVIEDLLPEDELPNGRIRLGKYTIEIVEERVVDRGVTLNRRRAVAFDERGVLILEGTPTFATDTKLLIEEIRFKLLIDSDQDGSIDLLEVDEILDDQDVYEIQDLESEEFQKELEDDEAQSEKDTIEWIQSLPKGKSRLQKIKDLIAKRKKKREELKKRLKKRLPIINKK